MELPVYSLSAMDATVTSEIFLGLMVNFLVTSDTAAELVPSAAETPIQ